MAVAGEDYVVCAADTRMSTGYSIMTRDYKKIEKVSSQCVMASAGFMADAATLKKTLKARCETYEFQNGKEIALQTKQCSCFFSHGRLGLCNPFRTV